MEENGFDPCECVWSHNMVMRRLLSLLRQSQDYCTDTECLLELPGSNVDTSGQYTYYMFLGCFLIAMLWFHLRPNPGRRRGEDVLKVRNNENDRSDNSSDPPPLC